MHTRSWNLQNHREVPGRPGTEAGRICSTHRTSLPNTRLPLLGARRPRIRSGGTETLGLATAAVRTSVGTRSPPPPPAPRRPLDSRYPAPPGSSQLRRGRAPGARSWTTPGAVQPHWAGKGASRGRHLEIDHRGAHRCLNSAVLNSARLPCERRSTRCLPKAHYHSSWSARRWLLRHNPPAAAVLNPPLPNLHMCSARAVLQGAHR